MARIVALLLGLAVLGFVASKLLVERTVAGKKETPKQTLDNVQRAANRIEAAQFKRAAEVEPGRTEP